MASLVLHARDGTTHTIELARAPITLGRADSCDLVLPHDAEVSREHAQVWVDEQGRVQVADKGSKNGTRVDAGEAFHNATRTALHSVRIGEYELQIVGADLPAASADDTVRFQPDAPTDYNNTRFFPPTRNLDLSQQRLTLLMSLAERIGGAFEPKQLLEQALDACCEALGFERGLIALKTQRGDPELPVTRNIQRDETGAYKVSRTLINRALVEGQRAVVNNPAVDLVHNLSESLVRFPIQSALCVPILHRERILGVLYGDRITRAATYTPEDVDFLAAIARQVGVGLENLRLFQAYLDTERLKQELKQARSIQRGLIPARPLAAGPLVLAGHNEPSEAVGGDYFDYFPLGGQRIGFIIADVTGHGLPAAMMMANMQSAVRVALTGEIPLRDVADRLNRLIVENTTPSVFITALLGRIDVGSGAVEFINAGHPAPLLLTSEGVRELDCGHALPLGVEADETFTVQQFRLAPDQAALMYTDGLVEAPNPAGRLLGDAAVVEALAALPARSPDAVMSAALGLVRKHLGSGRNKDDLTLMAVQYRPS
jgi:serine phosphatase RsbU (regulator of sigma subunit)